MIGFSDLRSRLRSRLERWQRALAYARDRMSEEQARRIFSDCQHPAGWFPLMVLSADDVLEDARAFWNEHPDLPRLARDAADRVSQKWDDHGDSYSAATEWALEKVEEYAEAEGIKLVVCGGETTTHKGEAA